MKLGNMPIVLVILLLAFAAAYLLSVFLTPYLTGQSPFPTLGSIGLNPTIPITVTTNQNEILVNKTVTKNAAGNFIQSAAITAGVPAVNNVCPTSNTIQFITDLGKLSSSTCKIGGTFHCLASIGYVQYGTYECVRGEYIAPCNCSVSLGSATPGVSTIVAQSITNPSLYINGHTQVTIDWPATSCFGTVKSCPSFVTATTCAAQGGCHWYGAAGCYGINTVSCSGLGISDCSNKFGCQWISGSCTNAPCSTWKTNPNACTAAGCNYTTTACSGAATSCDSVTDQTACSKETGCAWVGTSPILSVTSTTTTTASTTATTATTASTATTTTAATSTTTAATTATTSATTATTTETSATTGTTTTTTPPYDFTFSSFSCDSTSKTCSISYSNGGSQQVVIVLYLLSNQQLQQVDFGTVDPGTGVFIAAPFSCSSLASGEYNILFQVFLASDTSYSSPILSPTSAAVMACP